MGLLDWMDDPKPGQLDISKDEPSPVITVTPAAMATVVAAVENPGAPTSAMIELMEPVEVLDQVEPIGRVPSTMPGNKGALFTSARTEDGNDNWGTPAWLKKLLTDAFGPFDVDVCADADNAMCPRFYDEATDGLAQVWTGTFWCNPPYSGVADWVKKGYESVYVDKTADRGVFLVANRTETEWFHEYAAKGLVFFLRSRVKFDEPKDLKPLIDKKTGKVKKRSSPTFGSIVILFDARLDENRLKASEFPGGKTLMAASVDWRAAGKVKE